MHELAVKQTIKVSEMDTLEEPGTSPFPASMLDHKQTDLGIPNHCRLNSSCINFYRELCSAKSATT
jgi:hypothetical protein